MSLLDALSDKQRQSDQGWSYANSYNRSTNSFCNNSSPSGEEWPSPPTQQHCTLSTAGSGNNYAQEVKSSDTEDELMLVDDGCMELGREETIVSVHSPMDGSMPLGSHAHNTYVHNTQNRMTLQATYNQKQNAAQFVDYRHGTSYTMQHEYFPPRVSQVPPGELHSSHLPRGHMQLPLCASKDYPNQLQGHNAQQSVGQHQHQSHVPQHCVDQHHRVQQAYDQNLREQQPADRHHVQQRLDQHHQMEQQFDHHHRGQQLAVDQHQQGQQPVDQHHGVQQHAVGQHHGMPQPADQHHQVQQHFDQHHQMQQHVGQQHQVQQRVDHQHQVQQHIDQHHQVQQHVDQCHQVQGHVDQHRRVQQPIDQHRQGQQPVDQHHQAQERKPQPQGRLRQMLTRPMETSQSSPMSAESQHCGNGSQQPFQSQQSFPRQQSLHLTAHNPLQSHDHDAKYAYQQHGLGIGSDQHALQQQHQRQQQQAYSEQHGYGEQQQSLPSHQQPFYASVHSMYRSNQQEQKVPPHMQKHGNEQHERKSQQDHNAQEHSSQNLNQVLLQSSAPLSQNSHQIFLIHSPQVSVQNSPQISLQNSVQVLRMEGLPQVEHSSPQVLQNSFPVSRMNSVLVSSHNSSQLPCQVEVSQNGGNQLHVQKSALTADIQHLYNLPTTPKIVFESNTENQGFQENMYYQIQHNGMNSTVLYNGKELVPPSPPKIEPKTKRPAKGKGRGQPKPRTNHGGGGRGGRGRGGEKADSVTGLLMAPNHYKPDQMMEISESCIANPMREEDQGHQEVAQPKPQANNSPLQGTELTCINSNSPPPTSVAFPRLSATNEVWPTPMPCVKKERSESPPALIVDSFSSCSQQSSDSPDVRLSPVPVQEECQSSPSVVPAQHVSPPAPVQPAPEQKPEEPRRIYNLADDEEGTVLCKWCGYTSSNFDKCEGCSKKLPADAKLVIKKRKVESADAVSERERTCGGGKVNSAPSPGGPSLEKKKFYGEKLQTQGAAFSAKVDEFSSEFAIKNTGRVHTHRRGNGTSRGAGRGRKSRQLKEPVTVTISSDEDEGPSAEASRQPSTSSLVATPTAQEDDDAFFPFPVSKPTSFGTLRRHRMEDASGNCIQKTTAPPAITTVDDGIYFDVRGVRIGSMRTSGDEVRFMTRSIQFKVVKDSTSEELDFFVYVTELKSIKFSLSQMQPMLFISLFPGGGGRVRSQLKMLDGSREYFDPGSENVQKNMIVVIIDTVKNEKGLRQMLHNYTRVLGHPDFLQEITSSCANDLLVESTPPVYNNSQSDLALRSFQQLKAKNQHAASPPVALGDGGDSHEGAEVQEEEEEPAQCPMAGDAGPDSPGISNNQEDGSRSPSPRVGFAGPIEKLLTYPNAQTKGAITITNEDLFCLNKGELLNDIIVDFYPKYLFLEKFSEEDRNRTHIFSSFFYKRLTQRESRSSLGPDEQKLPPAQRRHNRVKTWTRHFDIFSKDFIFIPINEHSHWFLAVVCFPGLEGQEYISYQPMVPACSEEGGSAGDSESQSQCSTDDVHPDRLPDIVPNANSKVDPVLGKVISADVALKGKSTFSLGMKQPCILIFDSLMGPSRTSTIRILKEYLQVEWDLKKGTPRNMIKTVRGGCPKVPQQTNFSDCGVFVLQYIESFFENPIASFSIPMKVENWFPPTKVEKKREEIRDLILRLQAEGSR